MEGTILSLLFSILFGVLADDPDTSFDDDFSTMGEPESSFERDPQSAWDYLGVAAISSPSFQPIPANDCDIQAAFPYDGFKPDSVPGLDYFELNTGLALEACTKALAANPNSPRMAYQLGRAYEESDEYSRAAELYTQAARQGYWQAFNDLGFLLEEDYLYGVEDAQNIGMNLYLIAAEAGNVQAMNYFATEMEEVDTELAIDWYKQAAEAGHVDSMSGLADLYE